MILLCIEITWENQRVECFPSLLSSKYGSLLQQVFGLSSDGRNGDSFLCLILSYKGTYSCRFINNISLEQFFYHNWPLHRLSSL